MSERTYEQLRLMMGDYINADPSDEEPTMTEYAQALAKDLHRKGYDSVAVHFMVELAAYIDRNRNSPTITPPKSRSRSKGGAFSLRQPHHPIPKPMRYIRLQ